jgi:hypothetical protein
MKLAPPNSAAVRQERSIRLRRDRAAALALRAVFPEVQQLRLDLKFEDSGANTPVPQSHVLYPPARAYFGFPCPYADCDGQFDLTGAVNAAVKDLLHQAEGVLECAGTRPGESISKRSCRLRFVYTITATCQPDS